jgi:hypothetical protein
MVTVNKNLEVEYTDELNTKISEISVLIAEAIKDLPPLERFYAIKVIIEDLESRSMTFGVMQQIIDEKTPN